jgi:hypothetical protein
MVAKPPHSKVVPKVTVVPGTGIPPKAAVTSVAFMSNVAMTVTSSGAGALKFSARMKRPAAALSSSVKGKPVRLDAGPPSTSIVAHKVSTWPQPATGTDDEWVAYCPMLNSVPSESSSSSSD